MTCLKRTLEEFPTRLLWFPFESLWCLDPNTCRDVTCIEDLSSTFDLSPSQRQGPDLRTLHPGTWNDGGCVPVPWQIPMSTGQRPRSLPLPSKTFSPKTVFPSVCLSVSLPAQRKKGSVGVLTDPFVYPERRPEISNYIGRIVNTSVLSH